MTQTSMTPERFMFLRTRYANDEQIQECLDAVFLASADIERLRSVNAELLKACHAFCRTLAFTPSSIPGAIEADLNAAYEMARAAIAKEEAE